MTIGAKINTEVALLAKFFLYPDMAFHIISPKQFNAFDSIPRLEIPGYSLERCTP